MVYKFIDKKAIHISIHTGTGGGISENQQLANKQHKPNIRKFKKRKVYYLINIPLMVFISQTYS